MSFLYSTGIRLYTSVIYVASLFSEKARLWVKGRCGQKTKIKQCAETRGTARLVWFHAASLGEFEQGRPVMEALKAAEPETKILLTFFSPSGYEVRKEYAGADYVLYLPSDTPSHARCLIEAFRPDAAVFIKYEFWANYLSALHVRHIPIYLISAIFQQNQPFFKWWGRFDRELLKFFTRFFVQDDASMQRLKAIGIADERVCVAGDTRFDRVKRIAEAASSIERVEAFCCGKRGVVCGSTWEPDEALILRWINEAEPDRPWIIVPHEIGESRLQSIESRCKRASIRYSRYTSETKARVMIVDTIGILSSIYRYADIAYIGGGFGVGIHNTLEAAVYGIPVLFGPNYHRFREAEGLHHAGGAFPVDSQDAFDNVMKTLLETPSIREAAGQAAGEYVQSQTGATALIMAELTQITNR